ncbi:MAG: hypothetical protein ACUVTL_01150 [Thermoproteota archaeon]
MTASSYGTIILAFQYDFEMFGEMKGLSSDGAIFIITFTPIARGSGKLLSIDDGTLLH